MTHQQALAYCQKSINERIEEMGNAAREAAENGDEQTRVAARNFQNGLIECADLLDKMTLMVEVTGGQPSKEVGHG